jgi:hypothetical protein
MNTSKPAWRLIILLFLLTISVVSCHQAKLPAETATDNTSLETIYEIPEGTEPKRAETYDDIVYCGGRVTSYRANCSYVVHKQGEAIIRGPDFVESTEVTLSGWEYATDVNYRDYIETRAGEIRCNLVDVTMQTGSVDADELISIARQTGKKIANYKIKQRGACPGIWVRKIWAMNSTFGGLYLGNTVFYLTIEISPQVNPGDYTLHFVVEANGQNCGELPCIIHVIE